MDTGMQIATVKELAAFLRLKESTICSLASHGKLPGFKFGKAWRFDLKTIARMFEDIPDCGDRAPADREDAPEVR